MFFKQRNYLEFDLTIKKQGYNYTNKFTYLYIYDIVIMRIKYIFYDALQFYSIQKLSSYFKDCVQY